MRTRLIGKGEPRENIANGVVESTRETEEPVILHNSRDAGDYSYLSLD